MGFVPERENGTGAACQLLAIDDRTFLYCREGMVETRSEWLTLK